MAPDGSHWIPARSPGFGSTWHEGDVTCFRPGLRYPVLYRLNLEAVKGGTELETVHTFQHFVRTDDGLERVRVGLSFYTVTSYIKLTFAVDRT